jgi:hypothetical protein
MRILKQTEDVITVQTKKGKVIVLKEEEEDIINELDGVKVKAGYDDIELMSLTLREIFRPEHEELVALRKQINKDFHDVSKQFANKIIEDGLGNVKINWKISNTP